MRKFLFALVVIAASFAGGAVANNPSIRAQALGWVRHVLSSTESTIASVVPPAPIDDPDSSEIPPPRTASISSKSSSSAKPRDVPSAPLVLDFPSDPFKTKSSSDRIRPTQASASGLSATKLKDKPSVPISTASQNPTTSKPKETASDDLPSLNTALLDPPADPAVVRAGAELPTSNSTGSKEAASGASENPPAKFDPAVRSALLDPTTDKANPVVRVSDDDASGTPTVEGDWGAIRKRMTEAGVKRYRIEGEPDGSVRIVCIIPLAGEQAVSQTFEAEAEDEFQAAEAALRRIALWKVEPE